MRRELAGWAAGLGCVSAVGLAVAATRHTAHAGASPIDPAGAWRAAWLAGAIGALVLSGVAVMLARQGALRLRMAIGVALVVQALPLLAPLLLSQDAYLYWAQARVVTVHHANPYRVPPSRYPNDPATKRASPVWRTQTEAYGPAWVAVGTLPTLAAGTSRHLVQLLYRILAFIGIVATVLLVAYRTRSAASVALLGWSPVVALHFAGGGHNDALVALFLVVAVAFTGRVTSAVAWPIGSMFKAVPAVLLPLELASVRFRVSRTFWIALIASSIALASLATALFGTGWASTSATSAHGTSPIGGVHFLTEAGLRHRNAVVVGVLTFALVYVALLRRAWRDGRSHLGLAAAALCMCSSQLRPWYAVWPLALAAVEEDGVSQLAAFALASYVLVFDALPL